MEHPTFSRTTSTSSEPSTRGGSLFDSIRQSGRIMAVVRSRTPQHAREPALVRRFQFWRAQPDAVRNRCPPIRSEPGERDTGLRIRRHVPGRVVRSVLGFVFEYYSAPLVVRWDLDFDGSKETTATTVTMSAARLDGPSDRALAIETRHPTDGLGNEEHRRPHPQREPSGRILGAARCGRAQDRWTMPSHSRIAR